MNLEELADAWLSLQAQRFVVSDLVERSPSYARLLLQQATLLDEGADDTAVMLAMQSTKYAFLQPIDEQVQQLELSILSLGFTLQEFQATAARLMKRGFRPDACLRLAPIVSAIYQGALTCANPQQQW